MFDSLVCFSLLNLLLGNFIQVYNTFWFLSFLHPLWFPPPPSSSLFLLKRLPLTLVSFVFGFVLLNNKTTQVHPSGHVCVELSTGAWRLISVFITKRNDSLFQPTSMTVLTGPALYRPNAGSPCYCEFLIGAVMSFPKDVSSPKLVPGYPRVQPRKSSVQWDDHHCHEGPKAWRTL